MKTLSHILIVLSLVATVSCTKNRGTNDDTPAVVERMEQMVIDQDFDWSAGLKGDLNVSFENLFNASLDREYAAIVTENNQVVARKQVLNGTVQFKLNLPHDSKYYVYFRVTEDKMLITRTGDVIMELGPTATNDTKSYKSTSEVTSCTSCDSPIENPGGELPYLNSNYRIYKESDVPGWETTASDGKIEIWVDGFQGVRAQEGRQFFELNANKVAALYQELCLEPGSTITWSVYHRGRSGVDVADVRIGASVESAEVVDIMTDGKTAWGYYSGSYTVPVDQETTFFVFNSISSAGGSQSVGNFLDNFEIACDFDGDGISDEDDDSPENPNVSFVSYFPSSGKQVVAFEDLWPNKGDYDFNDLVLSNQVKFNKAQDFDLLSAEFTISIDAIGAGLDNGFGMMLYDVNGQAFGEDIIESISGDATLDSDNANGIIISEDVFETINERYQNNGIGITATPDTVRFTVAFKQGVQEVTPELYLFRTDIRSHEVHRSEFPGTAMADATLFNTEDDNGNYKTTTGLPWGIEILTDGVFKNPKEKVDILIAYPEFQLWATSAGTQNQTWYTHPVESNVVNIPSK
ncbi:MAG: LruC domain-containing protein [Bacteroidales bacterium]|nr:LruC domain-containing protein [Bacteroidales bacterium]